MSHYINRFFCYFFLIVSAHFLMAPTAHSSHADGFVFPVLGTSITDPKTNTTDPIGNGWTGYGVGWNDSAEGSNYIGHLGQDYYLTSGCSQDDEETYGNPVYAVANGIVVQVVDNPETVHGWDDPDDDHGWGRVVIIKHTLPPGFTVDASAIHTSTPNLTQPTEIFSLYGHLRNVLVSVNDTVTKGQQIAEIGNGGVDIPSNPCSHLHFELKNALAYGHPESIPTNPTSTAQCCSGQVVPGVGFGYSGKVSIAPNRYIPSAFITAHKAIDKVLIQSEADGRIYWLQNGKVYHVISPQVISDMAQQPRWDYDQMVLVTNIENYSIAVQSIVTTDGSSDGLLVKLSGSPHIYVIQGTERHRVPSIEEFNYRGYDWNDIIEVSQTVMDQFTDPTGTPILAVGQGAPNTTVETIFSCTYIANSDELGNVTDIVKSATSASTGVSGYFQSFDYGSIQYHSNGAFAGQAFIITNSFYEKWGHMGYANNPLGFPTGNRTSSDPETNYFGTEGDYQTFEGGSLQWNGNEPFAIYGKIYTKWGALGYASSPLGFPISEQVSARSGFGTEGVYQRFQGGSIQVIDEQAYAVYGHIYEEWGKHGYAGSDGFLPGDAYESGQLSWTGFPTSDRYTCAAGECQDFEGGYIESDGFAAIFISTTHPINLTIEENGDGSNTLSWENQFPAAGINVYRQGSPAERIAVLEPGIDSFTDQSSENGQIYSYFLSNYNNTSESQASNKAFTIINSGLESGPWPMFRKNILHKGSSKYKGHEIGLLRWRYESANGSDSSPVIDVNGVIYIGSEAGNLYAINPNGTLKWEYSIGSTLRASPAIDSEGTIYIGGGNGYFYAINSDGSFKWRYYTGYIHESSPAIDFEGTVYVGSRDDNVYAFNPDGTLKWRYQTGGDIQSSPAIDAGGTIYIGSVDNYLYAINPDGSLKWRYQTQGAIFSSPAIDDNNIIYFGSSDSYLYAINPDGSLKWRYDVSSGISCSAAIDNNGAIYFVSNRYLYALNNDGLLKWTKAINSTTTSSPIIDGDGSIYITHYRYSSPEYINYLSAFRPDGSTKWAYSYNSTSLGTRSSPAIGSDGTIYFGGADNYIYAIGVPIGEGYIYGKITDSESGEPISYATISANGVNFQANYYGDYSIALSEGIHDIAFSSGGRQTVWISNLDVTSDYSQRFDISLPISLYGIVTDDSNGEPLSGVTITTNTNQSTQTDENGNFEFGELEPGFYDINLNSSTHQSLNIEEVEIVAGESKELNISLPISLRGRVTDLANGQPISGVTITTNAGQSVQTDSQGDYSIGNLSPGIYNLVFSHDGYQSINISDVVITIGESTSIDIGLTISAPLEFISTDLLPLAIGSESSFRLFIQGGSQPYSYSVVTGSLPPGLIIDQSTGYITGVPTTAGIYYFTLRVADSTGTIFDRDFLIQIVEKLFDGPWPMFGANNRHTRQSTFSGPISNRVLWQKAFTRSPYIGSYTLNSNPSVDSNGNVYLGGYTYTSSGWPPTYTYYYDLLKVDLNGDWSSLGYNGYNRYSTPPAISEIANILLAGTDDSKYCTWNTFYAMDLDGSGKWNISGEDYRSAPAISANGKVYFGSADGCNVVGGEVHSVQLDGSYIWKFKPEGVVHFNTSPAIDSNGNIYISGSDNRLYSINSAGSLNWFLNGPNSSPAIDLSNIIYSTDNDRLFAISPGGQFLWEFPITNPSLPAISNDGTIYISGNTGVLFALTSRGELKWTFEGPTSAPSIDCDGIIYICSAEKLYAISDDGSPNILWSMDVLGGDPIIGTNNRLYIKRGAQLTAIGGLDSDNDGLSDYHEDQGCTDKNDEDSDDDGVPDGIEDVNLNGTLDIGETNPCNVDSDNDGIQDGTELGYTLDDIGAHTNTNIFQPDVDPTTTTDPLDDDTDNDGINDGSEDLNFNGRVDIGETNPFNANDRFDGPWPMFGHDVEHSRQSPFVGSGPWLKWRFLTGIESAIYWSSPAIDSNGTIYIGSYDYSGDGEHYINAVNPDGTIKWRYQTEGGVHSSSPAIGPNGTVYVGTWGGNLYAVDPYGNLLWTYMIGSQISSSPSVGQDGTIYIGSSDYYLYAISPDGNLLWRYLTGGSIYSSPAIGTDGTLYFGSYDDYLYSINPDGSLNWKFQTSGDIYMSSPSIGSQGTIYIGSLDNYFYAINSDGSLQWKYYTRGYILSSPAISSDGTIYFGSNYNYDGEQNSYLYALNPEGKLLWRFVTGGGANGGINSSPSLDLNGNIYFGTRDDNCYALNSNGQLLWKYQAGNDINSSPAIDSDGTIYVGSVDGYLYAFGLSQEQAGIFGRIEDLSYGNSIYGANISVNGVNTQSDTNGSFKLLLEPGFYDVTISRTGYETLTINDVAVEIGKATELRVELTYPGPVNIVTIELDAAEVDSWYNNRVRISGGIYPYTYAIASGSLPAGLTIDPSNGTISGTPTTTGSTDFWVSVTDSDGAFAAQQFTITVTQPLGIDTTSPLPRAMRTQPYSNSIVSSGGTLPHSFALSGGSLPSGLSLSSTGLLSGTPSAAGSYDFTIQVTDALDRTAEQSFHLDVDDPVVISTSSLNDGVVGTSFSQTLAATGGYGDYVWRVYAGQLPPGLFLDSMTGDISGTPTTAIYSNIVIEVSDEVGRKITKNLSMKVADPLQVLTTSLPDAFVGVEYSEQIRISGGIGPYTFSLTGLLPDGLSFNSSTGVISGIATSGMARNFSVTVQDSTNPTPQSTDASSFFLWSKTSLTVTTPAILPNAKRDVAISPIVLSAGGGLSPYTWQLINGYLPAGISLNPSTGELTGTPLDRGDFVFTLQVTDTGATTAEKEFFWHISDTLAITTGAVADGAQNDPYSFMLEASGGIQPYTWSIVNGSLPGGLSLNASTGAIYGTPTTRQSTEFTVRVVDADSPTQSVEHTYSMNVVDELLVFTPTLPNGRIDEAYTATVSAKLGVPPYSWRVSEGVLPPGITFTGSTTVATLEGTPTTAGTYTFTLEVTDTGTPLGTATREYTVEIYDNVVITTEDLPCAVRNEPYAESIATTGGKIPYTYQLTAGSLPLGLSLNSTSGEISGTTAEVGGFSAEITIQVTDAGNPSDDDEQQLTIYVIDALEITTDTLQDAAVGYAYLATLDGQGGISPHSWHLHSGNLPPGLELDSATGEINGTPTDCGSFDFTIRLEDAAAITNTFTKAFTMTVIAIGDADCDGLIDALENAVPCLDPTDADTDDDGIPDGVEDANHDGSVSPGETDPCATDTDSDGIQDGTEIGLTLVDIGPDTDTGVFIPDADPNTTTDPLNDDSDNDGHLDGEEDLNHNGAVDGEETDPNAANRANAMPWIPLLLLSE